MLKCFCTREIYTRGALHPLTSANVVWSRQCHM